MSRRAGKWIPKSLVCSEKFPPSPPRHQQIRETKDTVRVSLQEYLFTSSSKVTPCGFWQKRVRLSELLEGGLTALQEPTLTVLLALPNRSKTRAQSIFWINEFIGSIDYYRAQNDYTHILLFGN